jgi:hypothetical protein
MIQEIFDIVSKSFIENDWYACAIPASIMLYEGLLRFNKNPILKKGYNLIGSTKEATWYLWVEADGVIFDIGNFINESECCPKYKDLNISLSETIPSDFTRILIEREETNNELFNLYINTPSLFWVCFNDNADDTVKRIKNIVDEKIDQKLFQEINNKLDLIKQRFMS